MPIDAIKAGFIPVDAADTKPVAASDGLLSSALSHASLPNRPVEGASALPSPATERFSGLVAIYAAIYPGYQIHPKYWNDPLWAGVDPYESTVAMIGVLLLVCAYTRLHLLVVGSLIE